MCQGWENGELTRRGAFWDHGNVLYLACGNACVVYKSVETHWNLHLKSMPFTVYKLYLNKVDFLKKISFMFSCFQHVCHVWNMFVVLAFIYGHRRKLSSYHFHVFPLFFKVSILLLLFLALAYIVFFFYWSAVDTQSYIRFRYKT